jgi:hypothetical protein
LLIPKLDRFSRKVSFISGIIDQGIELVVCEYPNVSTFFLHLLACFAEEERRQISERTRAALAEAKKRGTVLGINAKALAEVRKQQKRQFVEANLSAFKAIWDQAPSASEAARRLNDAKLRLFEPTTDRFRGGFNLLVKLPCPHHSLQLIDLGCDIFQRLTQDCRLAIADWQGRLGVTNLEKELAAVVRPEPHSRRPVTSRKPCELCGLLGKPFDQSLTFYCHGILFGTFCDVNECKCLFGCHVVLPSNTTMASRNSQKDATKS